jgi:NAD(P)-dependent dehydrogenase (short-subunit alcohol dehydrogenase family)
MMLDCPLGACGPTYDPGRAYAESKTAAVLLAVEATKRWAGDGSYANAVNPGTIATGLQKHTGGLQTLVERRKSVEQGAATSVFLAASPLAERIGRRYFEDVSEADVHTQALACSAPASPATPWTPRFAELLWDVATAMP